MKEYTCLGIKHDLHGLFFPHVGYSLHFSGVNGSFKANITSSHL